MYKSTKTLLLFGIVLCSSPLHSEFPTPAETPGVLGKWMLQIVVAGINSAAIHFVETTFNRTVIATGESTLAYLFSIRPQLRSIKNEELGVAPDVQGSSIDTFPKEIKDILNKEGAGNGTHRPLLLYGESGSGKSTLARQIAYYGGGNYYCIHQDMLDPHADTTVARFIREYVQNISDETENGVTSTLNLEEFGKQLGYTGNPNTDALRENSMNSWKKLFEDLEKQFPKVRIITTTNFGIKEAINPNTGLPERTEKFDPAFHGHRMNIIEVKKPDTQARAMYAAYGCATHLKESSTEDSKNKTIGKKTQSDRNKALTDTWHVTTEMHAEAKKEHDAKISKLTTPWTFRKIVNPWSWADTIRDNYAARQLKTNGYHTPVITWNLQDGLNKEHDSEEKNKAIHLLTVYAKATEGKDYPALDKDYRSLDKDYRALDAITENARISKVVQIARMAIHNDASLTPEERTHKLQHLQKYGHLTSYKKPTPKATDGEPAASTYKIDPKSRTYSLTTFDYDATKSDGKGAEITVTAKYGEIKLSHLVIAATNKRLEERKKFCAQDPNNKDLQKEAEEEAATLSSGQTPDLKRFAERYSHLINHSSTRKSLKEFNLAVKSSRLESLRLESLSSPEEVN